jgi:LytS/YehU family sensor histidine kinase
VFAEDMKKIATANPIMAMTYGYRILAAMTDNVLSDTALMQRFRDLKPDLIIGDSTASYGHWLTALLGAPSVEFDVGTSSGLLHSLFGGQVNPAYIPASGKETCSCGLLQMHAGAAQTWLMKYACGFVLRSREVKILALLCITCNTRVSPR